MHLTLSQRDNQDAPHAKFVRAVGERCQPSVELSDCVQQISLSNLLNKILADLSVAYTTYFKGLIYFVHPDATIAVSLTTLFYVQQNITIDTINDNILDQSPGADATLSSDDCLFPDSNATNSSAFAFPEHLHNINVPEPPPHKLRLKSGTLAMLTRNLIFD